MSFRACILTVSTKGARGERVDESGEKISEALARIPAEVIGRAVVSDEIDDIKRQLREWLRATDPDLIVLTGGTGLGPRDVTPQAVEPLLDYAVPDSPRHPSDPFRAAPRRLLSHGRCGTRRNADRAAIARSVSRLVRQNHSAWQRALVQNDAAIAD